ncbi:MAG: SDR family oxidoreductase [Desulfobacterales bacterium]|nr:MAG: SDR family oxidoreductase [Desulfobacterales bacterium]
MGLNGKVAIITGASSGIGRAVARNLNEAGVRFLLTGRREDRLSELKEELNHAAIFPCDISDPGVPESLLKTALDSFGRCDIVFNNAGVITTGSIDEIKLEDISYMVRVNVEAAFRMAYVALKHFKSAGSGFLINTSSLLGTKVRPTAGAYAGTKFAIEALTEALRLELAKTNIGVACVEPGLVQTELHRNWEIHPAQSLNIPRPLKPEDIARVVRFILEQPDHVRLARILVVPSDQEL